MTAPADYICPKCKAVWPLTKPGQFCSCGGRLEKRFTMKDVEVIFPWLRKDRK